MFAIRFNFGILPVHFAGVAELVDAPDSKSGGGDTVWVRVPPSVIHINIRLLVVRLNRLLLVFLVIRWLDLFSNFRLIAILRPLVAPDNR